MNKNVFQYAKWICPAEFSDIEPIDVLKLQKSGAEVKPPKEYQNRHFLIQRRFNLEKKVSNTYMYITADDYYKLSINGKTVGQGPAQGYTDCYYRNKYDISEYLNAGENIILAELYYHGLVCRAYNSGDNRIGMAAELYVNGVCVVYTDSSWLCADYSAYDKNTDVVGCDTQFKERFDNRKSLKWESCAVKDCDYSFSDEPVTSVCRYYKTPKITKELSDGSIFYDFGEEITAMLEITAFGENGDSVEILCGEEADGTNVRSQMRCNCDYNDIFILKAGKNRHEQFDYKGFRYVKLIPKGKAEIVSLKAVVRHYPFDDDYCVLKTDNKLLRDIFTLCKNSVKYGSQEVFVDCPTREKGQYSGDLLITGSAHLILTGDGSLMKKAIDNQMQSAEYSDTLPAVTPGSLLQEIADYSLLFPLLSLRYYEFSNDKTYLQKNFEICKKIINGFRVYERADGLLQNVSDKWNLVDWPSNLRDGYDFKLEPPEKEPHNVLNAFYIGCVLCTEKISEILNINYEKRSDTLIKSFHNEFYDNKRMIYTDCKKTDHAALHSNVLPVFFGFAKRESFDSIYFLIMSKGLSCGVYMSFFVLKALCAMEHHKEALDLILSKSEHSWYNMLSQGATTCFEAWGKEQKYNTSLCHPWASSPIIILKEDILPNMPNVGKLIYRTCLESTHYREKVV